MKAPADVVPSAKLAVRLTPRSSLNAVLRYKDGVHHRRLTAPPVEGAANAACCACVTTMLGLRPSQVMVSHGHKRRDKVLAIMGLSSEAVQEN